MTMRTGSVARGVGHSLGRGAFAAGYKELTTYGDAMWNKGPLPGLYG